MRNKKWTWRPLLTVLLLVGYLCAVSGVSALPQTYQNIGLEIEKTEPTEILTTQTDMRQSFRYDGDALMGVSVKFATYESAITGSYLVSLYDDGEELLETVELKGDQIIDNQFSVIFFDEIHETGSYYLKIQAQEDRAETVSIWQSSQDVYPDGSAFLAGENSGKDWCFDLITQGPDTGRMLQILISVLLLLLLLLIWQNKWQIRHVYVNRIIYLVMLLYLLFMFWFCWKYLYLGSYDEMAHVSYVAYMQENFSFVPQFDKMYLLVPQNYVCSENYADCASLVQTRGVFAGKWTDTVNYLLHPPLYYWIMAGLGAVTQTAGVVSVNLDVLRLANMLLVLAGMLVFFYIGYSRIDQKYPCLHFMYAGCVATFPITAYLGVTVNNDNLSVLICAVYFLGMLRFVEEKKDVLTYTLIAVGITAAVLTKITTAVFLIVGAGVFLLLVVIQKRSVKNIFTKQFLWTLPIYGAACVYYLCQYAKFGMFQISLERLVPTEVFRTYSIVYVEPAERMVLTVPEFVRYFVKSFLGQWTSAWKRSVGRLTSPHRIAFLLWWAVPGVMLFMYNKNPQKKMMRNLFKGISFAVILAVFMQFVKGYRAFYYTSGHAGTQSRYYACLLPIFLFMLCWELEKPLAKAAKLKAAYLAFTVLWIYGGCFFYLSNVVSYVW